MTLERCNSIMCYFRSSYIHLASESIISVCFLTHHCKDIAWYSVGVMTILSSVMQLAMLPMQGIGQGAQPIASYNFGSKIKQEWKCSFKWVACF